MIRRLALLGALACAAASCGGDSGTPAEKACDAMRRAQTDAELVDAYLTAVLDDAVPVDEMRADCDALVQFAQEHAAG